MFFSFKNPTVWCSKEFQDAFAFELIGSKGVFLDLGCYHPFDGSNSAGLEAIGWTGLLFDIREKWTSLCKQHRKSPVFLVDVTSDEFAKILIEKIPSKEVDYISLDVDEAGLGALEQMLTNGIRFKCMTFEHDSYARPVELLRDPSRQILLDHGYMPLFKDVLTDGTDLEGLQPWEDWWVDPQYFDDHILGLQESNIFYKTCIKKIKQAKARRNQ